MHVRIFLRGSILVLGLLLVPAVSRAQQLVEPNLPVPASAGAATGDQPPVAAHLRAAPIVGSSQESTGLPRTPRFREVADKKFWLLAAAGIATSVLDIEALHHCVNSNANCREGNPLLGSSRAQQYGVKLSMNSLFLFGIYRYKRMEMMQRESGRRSSLPPWWTIGNAWTALNLATSAYNLRLGSPAKACPSGTACTLP